MLPEIGHFSLILALCLSFLFGVLCFFKKMPYRSLVVGQFIFIGLGYAILTYAFLLDDFSVAYVAHNSNITLPWYYKICAVWGAHEGSLLLWILILSGWTIAFTLFVTNIELSLKRHTIGVLGLICFGLLLLLLETSNPFLRFLPFVPKSGADLNPLLQDLGFVLHPPILYMGYVGLSIPFALAMGMLLKNDWNVEQLVKPIRVMKSFLLLAWMFLTIGIALGSWWAYYELGWGGWWFWDPVENASFMPWLAATALLHSVIIFEKKKLFLNWVIVLAIITFSLSLIGTFLVRSGVITSVHAFASDPERGLFILIFLSLIIGGALLNYGINIKNMLMAEKCTGSDESKSLNIFSKEMLMLFGSILLIIVTFSILLGTIYPLITEAIWGDKISVGSPYFNKIFIPFMGLVLVLVMVAPYLKWNANQKSNHMTLKVTLCLIFSYILSFGLSYIIFNKIDFIFSVGLGLGVMLILLTLLHLWPINTAKQRLPMIIAHCGLGVAVLGIVLSSHLSIEKDIRMKVGEYINVGNYQFHFKDIQRVEGPNYVSMRAEFIATAHESTKMKLFPEKRFFMPRNISMTETALNAGFLRDLYISLGEPIEDENWTVRIYVKPFVRWIWLGALLMAFGGLLKLFLQPKLNRDRV